MKLIYMLIMIGILSVSSYAEEVKCRVTRVIDGDTFYCTYDTSARVQSSMVVRLLAVDTPEVFFGKECFADQASAYSKGLLTDAVVRLQIEGVDKFNRKLAHVFLGYLYVNADLLLRGYAKSYIDTYPQKMYSNQMYQGMEDFAKKNQLGLWGQCVDVE